MSEFDKSNIILYRYYKLYNRFAGVQYIRDCPRGPNIPVYMVVGGTLGGIRMFWTLYSQIRSRRPEVLTVPGSRSHISFKKLVSVALSFFLVGWFVLGE